MAAAGILLARRYPAPGEGRTAIAQLAAVLTLAVLLIIPFRIPREPVEVVLIPLVVHLIGLGWLAVGWHFRRETSPAYTAPTIAGPLAALIALIALFQLVLRPGVSF